MAKNEAIFIRSFGEVSGAAPPGRVSAINEPATTSFRTCRPRPFRTPEDPRPALGSSDKQAAMTSLQNSADGVAVVPSEGVATPAVASSSLVPVVDSVNAEKPPTDDEIEGTLAGLPGLPSNFGSTFSYVKNQGHEERTGFGLTFNASDTETTAVAAAASAAVSETAEEKEDEKPVGCWSSFVDFLYLGPRVVNEPEYTQLTKRAILIIISVTGILGPLTGSIYSPALPAVKADFQTTTEWVNGTLTAGVIAL